MPVGSLFSNPRWAPLFHTTLGAGKILPPVKILPTPAWEHRNSIQHGNSNHPPTGIDESQKSFFHSSHKNNHKNNFGIDKTLHLSPLNKQLLAKFIIISTLAMAPLPDKQQPSPPTNQQQQQQQQPSPPTNHQENAAASLQHPALQATNQQQQPSPPASLQATNQEEQYRKQLGEMYAELAQLFLKEKFGHPSITKLQQEILKFQQSLGVPTPTPQVVMATSPSTLTNGSSSVESDGSGDSVHKGYTYPMKPGVELVLTNKDKDEWMTFDANVQTARWKPERGVVDFDPERFRYPKPPTAPPSPEPATKKRRLNPEEKKAREERKKQQEAAKKDAKKEDRVNTMYLNRIVKNPGLTKGSEENFVLRLTPFHFAQALYGGMRFGFEENLNNLADPWQDANEWKTHKKKMAEVALQALADHKQEHHGVKIYVQRTEPKGKGIFSGYAIPAFTQICETNGSQFPVFCHHCVQKGKSPQECLICWGTVVHQFPVERRPWKEREGVKSMGERTEFGPVKTYVRVEQEFPHDSACQSLVFKMMVSPSVNALNKEEYVNIRFPTDMVVREEFQHLREVSTKGDFKNPMRGVPFGKGVDRIANGIEGYDLDDRAYIKLPVKPGKETKNARLLLGDACMTPESFPNFYIRAMYSHMVNLSCVSEMCPFVAHWPLEKETKPRDKAKAGQPKAADGEKSGKRAPRDKILPQWLPNGNFHLVIRDMTVLFGGMYEKPLSDLGFHNKVTPQLFHMDDTSLDEESRDPSSPFYRYGPDNKAAVIRPHSAIFPIFFDETRTVAIHHPSNKKTIWHNQLLAFDGAVKHGGCTFHPCKKIVEEAVVGIPLFGDGNAERITEDVPKKQAAVEKMMQSLGEARRNKDYSLGVGYTRRYDWSVHFHVDSMLAQKKRSKVNLDLSFYGSEEHPVWESPAVYSKMNPASGRAAHRRKEDEVYNGARLMIDHGKILADKATTGIFKAKLVAGFVACMPSKDLEEGVFVPKNSKSKEEKQVVPEIPKGLKAAPALGRLVQGMLQRAGELRSFDSSNNRTMLKACAKAIETVMKASTANDEKDTEHEATETDDDEDYRRKNVRMDRNKTYYTDAGNFVYDKN
jgi:hypothetical protein